MKVNKCFVRFPVAALLFSVVVFLSNGAIARDGYTGTITVVVGQTRIFPYAGARKVSIGQEDIANAAQTAPNEILITGLKVGETDFRIWTSGRAEARYLLKVVDNSWQQVLSVSRSILANVEGVSVRADNAIVFVEGRLLRSYDLGIINDLKTRFSSEIGEGKLIFNVTAPSVSLKAMVMLDVKVIEVSRSKSRQLGIDWGDSVAGPTFAYTGVFRGAGNLDTGESILSFGSSEGLNVVNLEDVTGDGGLVANTSLSSVIRFLEDSGTARVLAEPKLITTSGSAAEFLGGGEVPIPVRGDDGELDVTFRQVGVTLNIEPVADPDGYISTKLEVEVSNIDTSVTVLGIPGFSVRRTISEMNMLSGQTMVAAGMLNTQDGKALSKLPFLSKIPFLGELFKSRNFNTDVTEIMVFVTPYLVDPDGSLNKGMMDRAKELEGEEFKFSIFD